MRIDKFIEFLSEDFNVNNEINIADVNSIQRKIKENQINIADLIVKKFSKDYNISKKIALDFIHDFRLRCSRSQLFSNDINGEIIKYVDNLLSKPDILSVLELIEDIKESPLIHHKSIKFVCHESEIINKVDEFIQSKSASNKSGFRYFIGKKIADVVEEFKLYIIKNPPKFQAQKGQKLDKVVDFDGTLVNKEAYLLHNGKNISIICSDNSNGSNGSNGNKEYAIGISSSGNIFAKYIDDNGNVLDSNGIFILDGNGTPWNIHNNYSDDNTDSSSWSNIKVDKDMFKKVRRFSKALLVSDDTVIGLEKKLKMLSNPKNIKSYNSDYTQTMRQQIACVILLKYLQEIKDQFNPTTGGCLFETFLAGLITARIPSSNSSYFDMISSTNSTTYQIKFYDDNAISVQINPKKICQQYIIALKENTRISIYRLSRSENGSKVNDKRNILNYLDKNGSTLDIKKFKKNITPIILDLSKIKTFISDISQELNEIISGLYQNIGELNYNIESILTGVDSNNQTIDDYGQYYTTSDTNLNNIKGFLDRLDISKFSGKD
jgi:hypothetical protein